MDLVDLNPGPVLTRVGETVFKLRLFDLKAVVWAESFFSESDRGGLNAMHYVLNNPDNWNVFSSSVTDIAFYLAEDLEPKTQEEFRKLINASNPSQAIAILQKSISEVLKKSFPQGEKTAISGGEIFNKTIQNEGKQSTDWSKVYADFYRFGGMTVDQFYSMTMTQIDSIYSQIDESRTREKVESQQFDCSIHGVKKQNWPKMPQRKAGTKEIDQDEIKRRQEAHEKLFKGGKWPEK